MPVTPALYHDDMPSVYVNGLDLLAQIKAANEDVFPDPTASWSAYM